MKKGNGKPQANQSSARLLQVMECLASIKMPMRLQDIALKTGLKQSTVLRYLYTLEDLNYVYQEEDTLRYALTWKVCSLSSNLESALGLRNITTPYINKLANTLRLGVCLVTDKGNECLYLDCIDSPSTQTLQRVGKRAPLHTTSTGKLLLSRFDSQSFKNYTAAGLEKLTDRTITDADVLEKELQQIRTDNCASDYGECEDGLRCLAMPLKDYSGQIIAAISVFGPYGQMTDEHIKNVVFPALLGAITEITVHLGGDMPKIICPIK